MTSLGLSSEEVVDHIQQKELVLRCSGLMGSFAEDVFRYGSFVGSSIECHNSLARTMDYGRHHIDTQEKRGISIESGRVILADSLTASKGRFARQWHAPVGGIWGCLIHANTLLPQSAMLLSLAVGVAACETVRQVGVETAVLRWVNDVLIDGRKVAGFLIESHTGPVYGEEFHLIGFGINVNNCSFPTELAGQATSICDVLGCTLELKKIALYFITKLIWNIGLLHFVEARQLDWIHAPETIEHPVVNSWKSLSDILGKRVTFGYDVIEKPQYCGVVTGLAPDGGLQLTLEDGSTVIEHSGEVRYF